MKLTYEDKVQIYELRKQGESFKRLSNQFGVNVSGLKYMVKLIDHYGINIIKKGKNRYYSPKLKREIIDKVLSHFFFIEKMKLAFVTLHNHIKITTL